MNHPRHVPAALAAFLTLSFTQVAGVAQEPGAFQRPLEFVANHGQWDPAARYLLAGAGQATWIVDDGLWVVAEDGADRGVAVQFRFAGSRGGPVGQQPTGGVRNWLRGAGRDVVGVPVFTRVRHDGLYPGTDLVLREQDGHVEYDLLLAPGAELGVVRVQVRGHDGLQLDKDGSLLVATAIGTLRQTPPQTWSTDTAGRRQPLPCRFVLHGDDEFGFAVEGWSGGELTIDPGLIWGSFLGGGGIDRCTQLGLDSQGRAVVGGTTASNNLPTTAGCYRPSAHPSGTDVFVALVGATGSNLVFCTYLGGTGDETLEGLRVVANDAIAVSGTTFSTNFPTTANGYQTAQGGAPGTSDGFVAVLTATGSALTFGSYFGGTDNQSQVRLDLAANGDIFLAGRTTGSVVTTANAFQGARSGPSDIFLAVLNRQSAGSTTLTFGTYFGGTGDETEVNSILVDPNLVATIGAATRSIDCPISGTYYQNTYPAGANQSGFIVCLQPGQPTGPQALLYASYFGASTGTTERVIVDMDSAGFFTVCATTNATNWPTNPVSFQTQYGGGARDGIVCRFNPGATGPTAIILLTYLGGSGEDRIEAFRFFFTQNVTELSTIVGSTTSTNFPVTAAALQASPNGTGSSGFIAQIDTRIPGPGMMPYGSYYDACGASDDVLHAVQRSANGELTVAGSVNATVAPGTAGGFLPVSNGGTEGIVARLDTVAQPPRFSTFGSGCGAPGFVPAINVVTAPRMCLPFACTVNNVRDPGVGIMFMGLSNTTWFGVPLPRDLTAQGMPGCQQWISVEDSFFLVHPTGGSVPFGFTVPGSMLFYNIDLYIQYGMFDTAANPFGVAVSNAARLNIQF